MESRRLLLNTVLGLFTCRASELNWNGSTRETMSYAKLIDQ